MYIVSSVVIMIVVTDIIISYWSFGQKYVVRVAICAEVCARTTGFSTNPKAP